MSGESDEDELSIDLELETRLPQADEVFYDQILKEVVVLREVDLVADWVRYSPGDDSEIETMELEQFLASVVASRFIHIGKMHNAELISHPDVLTAAYTALFKVNPEDVDLAELVRASLSTSIGRKIRVP